MLANLNFRASLKHLVAICAIALLPSALWGNGINRNGIGARSISLGGASVAEVSDTFAAANSNPALLGFNLSDDYALGLVGVIAEGEFDNGGSRKGLLDDGSGVFPEIAVRRLLRDGFSLGFSFVPEQARSADWVYQDLPGGVDGATTYGVRAHRSDILGIRSAVSLGWQIHDTLSLGAGLGVTYNRNRLVSPYLFQSHPALAGFKTLLDLETDGFGVNGDLGLAWKPTETVTVGLSYRTPTRIDSSGSAEGDIGAQLDSLGLAVPSGFRYSAEVENTLPDYLSAGISWEITPKTRLALQADWIGWEDSFDELTVRLTDGNNSAINGLLKSTSITDTVPLDWQDRIVFRAGIEHEIVEDWFLRLGYAHGEAPMPVNTTLPMTAAISEHSVGIGVGHVAGPFRIDLAYQVDLPASRSLHGTRILSGEYEGSKIDLSAHWIALTVGYEF